MTIPENLWGYHKQWDGYIKTTNQLIEMLARCVALNGNFLLNFGPTEKGDFREEERSIMNGIGKWMDKYGSAIYESGYAGLERQDWGYYTASKDSKLVNMIVFNFPASGILRVKLNKEHRVSDARFMHGKSKIEIQESVNGEYFLKTPCGNYNEPFVIQISIAPVSENGNHYMPPLI